MWRRGGRNCAYATAPTLEGQGCREGFVCKPESILQICIRFAEPAQQPFPKTGVMMNPSSPDWFIQSIFCSAVYGRTPSEIEKSIPPISCRLICSFGSSRANPNLGHPQPKPSITTLIIFPEFFANISLSLTAAVSDIRNIIIPFAFQSFHLLRLLYRSSTCMSSNKMFIAKKPLLPMGGGERQQGRMCDDFFVEEGRHLQIIYINN